MFDSAERTPEAVSPATCRARWRSARRAVRRGVSAVEFALVAPVVLFLVVGMVEYINAEFIRHGIAEAAYEGARNGIVRGATEAEVVDATSRRLRLLGLDDFDVTARLDDRTVDVQVDVPLAGNSFGLSMFITVPSLQARYVIDRERS